MTGLAFEKNSAARGLKDEKESQPITGDEKAASKANIEYMEDILSLSVEDMFHYCFNYIGVLTGPYFSYRTFRDYFTARYWEHVNCGLVLINRFKWILVYMAFFLACSYFWPISVSKIYYSNKNPIKPFISPLVRLIR